MQKINPNSPCPCGSILKYKKCCAIYHKGSAVPKTALLLMKSRYCAYVLRKSDYIIKTTHPHNPDYTTQVKAWKESIDYFSTHTDFLDLEIIESIEGETESYVTFRAKLNSGDLVEKSHFLKVNEHWLYVDGEFE